MNGHNESERKKETSKAGIRKIANKWNLPWCSLSFIETNNLCGGNAIIQSDIVTVYVIYYTHFVEKVQADEDTIRSTFS